MPLRQYWNLFYNYLRPQSGKVLLLITLILGGIGLQLVNPQIIRYFIDTAETGGAQRALLAAAGLFLFFAFLRQGVTMAAVYVGEGVGWTATNNLRADLALHCLQLDMSFHKARTPGELIERIDGDVGELAGLFSHLVFVVLGNVLLIIGILVLLFREDWRLGLGGLVYALLILLILRGVQRWAVQVWGQSRQANAELFGFLEERLGGTEDIRGNGGEPYIMRRFYQLMRNLLQRDQQAELLSGGTFLVAYFLYVLSYALGLAIGAYLFSQGQLTIGGVYLIVYYIGLLEEPLSEIRHHVAELQQATASVGRVAELFAIRPRVQDNLTGQLPKAAGQAAVQFDHVSFAYDDTPGNEDEPLPVLQDVSFHLQPGRVLGLLGRTGSGKTTLTRLLFRLYDPTAGQICLDGADLRQFSLGELRDRVGMVTQDVQLFHATIRDNLTFFNARINDEAIVRVLDELGLRSWLESLPAGLDTLYGAGGVGLSAGQAQLLAFARVFLKDPGLVILDEASSRLDPATEQLLERAIDRLLHGRTGLIIAHRLKTVYRADEIMILDAGHIVEYGRRETLAHDPQSRFYHLLQTGMEEALA
jgi:ATP-binding cassette, subfamily B, bacterial